MSGNRPWRRGRMEGKQLGWPLVCGWVEEARAAAGEEEQLLGGRLETDGGEKGCRMMGREVGLV